MKKLLLLFFALSCLLQISFAQTARVYRAGALIGTYTTLADASAAANIIGDSILLSPHTFYEHDVYVYGGQTWQGTMTVTDTSIIDAESKGRIFLSGIGGGKSRALVIRDIICTHGMAKVTAKNGGAISFGPDSLILRGHTIIRNSYASERGGGISTGYAFDHVKITGNYSDSFGGGAGSLAAYDSVEISYNTARFGGGVGAPGAGFVAYSNGVVVKNNTALIGGGGVYGTIYNFVDEGPQIIYNSAPLGAAFYARINIMSTLLTSNLTHARIYNPLPDGKRQNEIYLNGGKLEIKGTWFGKSDTIGLIASNPAYPSSVTGKYSIANWSVNWGKPIISKDTLFPIGAGFTNNDGTSLPLNSLPWLTGNFSSSAGKMLTPNPKISATDTVSSLFRTYVYPTKGDTTSKPIHFVCSVDGDTFRTSPRVWGLDSIKLGINNATKETQVMVYPNPAKEVLNIQGVEIGSSIELYDIMGKIMHHEKAKMNNAVLNVKLLPAGVYHLKTTTTEGNVGTAKVVKE